MSSDISITVNHPDGYSSSFEVGNYTSNVNPMLIAACGVSMGWFDGMTCKKARPILAHAHKTMRRQPMRFRTMNPDNGWGDYDSYLKFLTRWYAMVRLHPTGTIRNFF